MKNAFKDRPSGLIEPVEPQNFLAQAESTHAEKGVSAGCDELN